MRIDFGKCHTCSWIGVSVGSAQTEQMRHGVCSHTLSPKPDKNEKKLEKDVADVFKKFPPKSNG